MKKIFTLIAAALMAVGVNAQNLLTFPTDGNAKDITLTDGEFFIHAISNKDGAAIDENNQYFGTADEYEVITTRWKPGGKADNNVNITATTPARGYLYIYVRSASSGATDRALVVKQDDSEYFNQVIKENEATDYALIEIEGNEKKVFPVVKIAVLAGTINITWTTNGLNFYGFKFVEDPTATPSSDTTDDPDTPDDPVSEDGFVNFPAVKNIGYVVSGTTEETTVKINNHSDEVPCLKLNNGYTTEGAINANRIDLMVEGGFLAGDIITFAGVFNNSDDSKQAAITIFTGNEGESPADLFTSDLFINGRTVAGEPEEASYTLKADTDNLHIGRANGLSGTTATSLVLLKVERPGDTGLKTLFSIGNSKAPIFNLAGQKVNAQYKGITIQNGKKVLK